jgi:hypothetical protein
MFGDKEKITFEIRIPKESAIEIRKKLFLSGVSLTQFFSYMALLLERNDPAVEAILSSIVERQKKEVIDQKKMNPNSLYNLLESESPFNERE